MQCLVMANIFFETNKPLRIFNLQWLNINYISIPFKFYLSTSAPILYSLFDMHTLLLHYKTKPTEKLMPVLCIASCFYASKFK